MSVNAVNCVNSGIVSQQPKKDPLQDIQDRAKQRTLIRQELRYNELLEKEKDGTITQDEKRELYAIRVFGRLDQILTMPKPTVFYCA